MRSRPGFLVRIRHLERRPAVRYLVSAGLATVVDALSYTALIAALDPNLGRNHWWPLNSTDTAISISFSLGLVTNFLLSKFYVFAGSTLRTRTQMFRFLLVNVVVLVLNRYALLGMYELLAAFEGLPLAARNLAARLASAVGVGFLFSYPAHRLLTFGMKRTGKLPPAPPNG